jgi:nucleoid-associated protein YgaU
VLLSLTVVPAVAAGVASAFSPSPSSSTTVVVQPGQSLWQVAQATAPNGDTASMVARIADANGITSADQLRPGQRLEVPLS